MNQPDTANSIKKPQKITNTFSILADTDAKLKKLCPETFRSNQGDVIDLAVDELWKKLHPDESTEPIPVNEELARR